jgi:hypothetical protein
VWSIIRIEISQIVEFQTYGYLRVKGSTIEYTEKIRKDLAVGENARSTNVGGHK